MSDQEMLEEIKNVLKITGASEEKVCALREDLCEGDNLCEQLKESLKELRKLENKRSSELDDNQQMKTNIKKLNKELLSSAQLVYQLNQEMYSILKVQDAERFNNEELLRQNEEKIKERSAKYKNIFEKLKQEQESLENEETDIFRKWEIEAQILCAENEELEEEIKMLIVEEQLKEHYIKKESVDFDDEENRLEKLNEFQENVKLIKSEIEETSKLLEEKKKLGVKLESDGVATLSEWDLQISETESQMNEATSSVNVCKLNIDEVTSKIETLEIQIKTKEEECKNYESEITNTKTVITASEDEFNKGVEDKEKLLSECEEIKCKQQQELNELLETETRALKFKIDAQQECVNQILEHLAKQKTNTNLNEELHDKEEKRKNLKSTHQRLKEDFEKRILEMETEISRLQADIKTKEQTNKKVQEDTDSLVSELSLLKCELDETNTEIEQNEGQVEKLDGEIENLYVEVERTKGNTPKMKKQNLQDSQASSTSPRQRKKKPRHWDSDSSIEGEDRSLSNFIKQKIKMEKMKKK